MIQDFPWTQQKNFIDRKLPAFQVVRTVLNGKSLPSIIQTAPGSIAFYVRTTAHPKLSFQLAGPEEFGKATVELQIESDSPSSFHKVYRLSKPSKYVADLKPVENRIVRITFTARGRKARNLKWINPTLEQPENEKSVHFSRAANPPSTPRNVMIVLLDAANPLHFGCYGYDKPTTPNIDQFAKESVLWEKAFAPAAYTLASTGSLLTGTYPDIHQVVQKTSRLSDDFQTVAELFQNAGFETAQFVGNGFAGETFGYHQGFEYKWLPDDIPNADHFLPVLKSWIEKIQNNRFFAYIHMREPHYPFRAPKEFFSRFNANLEFRIPIDDRKIQRTEEEKEKITAAYDANLAFGDQEFGRMINYLKQRGLWENTLFILLSDHGEAFWEHGWQGHNNTLYDEMVRIPLIMRFPQGPRGIRKREMVSTMDIMPTLVHLFGLRHPTTQYSGTSLLPAIFTNGRPVSWDRVLLLRTSGQHPVYGVRTAQLKYIYTHRRKNREELYDLKRDPREQTNLASDHAIIATYYRIQLKKELHAIEQIKSAGALKTEQATPDQATEEQLRALGYTN